MLPGSRAARGGGCRRSAPGFVSRGSVRGGRGWFRPALDRLCGDRDDYSSLQRRKATGEHRACRKICRGLWMIAGGIMIVVAELSVIIAVALATAFLCFALLDER